MAKSLLTCDSVTSVMQIKDEQGNFKNENFSELRHVAFGIKDQDGNADGEKPAVAAPARSASVSKLSSESVTKAVRTLNHQCMRKMIPSRNFELNFTMLSIACRDLWYLGRRDRNQHIAHMGIPQLMMSNACT